jgi:hypothetical protein
VGDVSLATGLARARRYGLECGGRGTRGATIIANGKTIQERDTWSDFLYPDGSRTVGNTVHFQGPGGIVQHDAGQLVFDTDGNVVAIHGPHPQFLGETFCPALMP